VVLKGSSTVIAAPDGRTAINLGGSAAMAKAGSGDVLTGVIGALLCRLSPWDSACLGVWVHTRSGDLEARKTGPHGLMASDLLPGLGPALQASSEASPQPLQAGAPLPVGVQPLI
jgi:ADP-dependent NAD(P)H-hydrate dehydratase / NAD(P)H-hydrate epimerase